MNRSYDDVLALTDRKPSFFQAGGFPRWEDFRPGASTDVYARDCAIAEIACQLCDTRFHVLMESTSRDRRTIREEIHDRTLAYRDPPNVGCCSGGPSMTSETVRVLECWERMEGFQWRRDASAEVHFRRFQDPWTDDMRERAQAMADDPAIEEDLRRTMREGLLADDERRTASYEAAPEPTYASEFRTTAAPREAEG
jgi:hypothetical protein